MSDTQVESKPPLDEVMLAMDVVDTLRHRERVVERALTADDRDQELVERLKEIYAGQGIEVSDAIVSQGVRDLRADRFVYAPPPPSFGRTLARLYVTRRRWAPAAGIGTAVIAVLLLGYQVCVRGPELAAIAALPAELEQVYTAVVDLAEAPELDTRAESIRNGGRFALAGGDYDAARLAISDLESMRSELALSYDVRVRSAPGELSGVWRIPDTNPNAQNFYLVVEAIGEDGKPIRLPITNQETGRTSRVTRWAQRVDESMFQAIAADKQDDGIIQGATIGRKRAGVLDPVFVSGVENGAITEW
jgi:Family of unknown function (DUF6384)